MFQTHKVIIFILIIFSLFYIGCSYQYNNMNLKQNYTQTEQNEPINLYPELFPHNIIPLTLCLFYINHQI